MGGRQHEFVLIDCREQVEYDFARIEGSPAAADERDSKSVLSWFR
ncbi:MAG: hypothetical protein R3C99_06865 [Pirellulaceae bacterium]